MIGRPQALPDEIEHSYLGAFMRINGVTSKAEALDLITRWSASVKPHDPAGSPIDLLSRVAGIDLANFVRQHTTLPLRRGVASTKADVDHGSAENQSLHQMSGTRKTRPGAFFCLDCVSADHDFHGRSYWRREHQTPGLYWCPKHRVPLRYRSERDAFLKSPSECVENSDAIDESWANSVSSNPFVKKYLGICAGLMDGARPIVVRQVRGALVSAAKAQRIRTFPTKALLKMGEHLVSDLMLEAYPREWVLGLVPSLVAKARGQDLRQVDGVFWHTAAGAPSVVYALTAALLFDSADDALQALATHVAAPATRTNHASPRSEQEAARHAYVVADGSYSVVLNSLRLRGPRTLLELESSGLPDLSLDGSPAVLRAAVAFYLEDRPLHECLLLAGDERDRFESIVRRSGNPLKAALREMATRKEQRTVRHHRSGSVPMDRAATWERGPRVSVCLPSRSTESGAT